MKTPSQQNKRYPYIGAQRPDLIGQEFTCSEFAEAWGISVAGALYRLQTARRKGFPDPKDTKCSSPGLTPTQVHEIPQSLLDFHKDITTRAWR